MIEVGEKPHEDKALMQKYGNFYSLIFCILLCVGLFNEFQKNSSDRVDYSYNEGVLYFEAKCLYGSILNQDRILVTEDNIKISHHNQMTGIKVETLPYSSIKEIAFRKSLNGYKVEISKTSKLIGTDTYTFYLNQKATFKNIDEEIRAKSKNRCPITEEIL